MSQEAESQYTKKRFSPSPEGRVDAKKLQQVIIELQTKLPGALGATVFGSLVKTRTEEEAEKLRNDPKKANYRPGDSDIDGTFFFDAERVDTKVYVVRGLPSPGPNFIGSRDSAYFEYGVQKDYEEALQESLQREIGLEPDQISIKVRPISREVIDKLLTLWVEQQKEWSPGAYPSHMLVELFHLAIGGKIAMTGLQRYRAYVIAKLVAMGEKGEQMWSHLIRLVETSEHDAQVDPERYYPRTLAEARRKYGDYQENDSKA